MRARLRRLRRALEHEDVRSISRRYFISNGFDGALTSVGVTVGAYLSGIADGLTVFSIGIGAAIGLGTSGVWSVWEIERAEKQAELARVERAMLTNLDETRIQRQKEQSWLVAGARMGLAGVLVALLNLLLPG